jgi:hypothetical protein
LFNKKTNTTIIVRYKGGIGNQFFIYFYSQYLLNKLDSKIYVDSNTGFKRDFKYKRKFLLNFFFKINPKFFIPNLPIHLDIFYIQLLKFIGNNNFLSAFFSFKILSDKESLLNNIDHYKILYVDGYFQDPNFFEMAFNNIQKNFILYKHEIGNHSSLKKICLHLRFYSDLSNQESNDYIKKIESFLTAKEFSKDNYILNVYSENNKNQKIIEHLVINYHFVHIKFEGDDLKEFELMSNSDIFILSNSTFGFSAALISKLKKNKTSIFFPVNEVYCRIPHSWQSFASKNNLI